MKNKKFFSRLFFGWVLFTFLSGCSVTSELKYGKNFDESKQKRIEKGTTTKKNLLSLFGEPYEKGVDEQGKEWWVYVYQEEQFKTRLLASGYAENIRAKELLVVLNGDIVEDFTYTDNKTKSAERASQGV